MPKVLPYDQLIAIGLEVETKMREQGHVLQYHRKGRKTTANWNRPDRTGTPRNHFIRCKFCKRAGVVEKNGTIRGDALNHRCTGLTSRNKPTGS